MGRFASATLAVAIAASPTLAQHGHGTPGEALGMVSFPTSCAPAVQPRVDRAVAMLHSFWFEEAHKAFSDIAVADTTCAMAHWGIAMTLWGNPFVRQPIPTEQQRTGLAAADRAAALAPRAQHRERMYIDAALALWRDAEKLDHLARLARHEDAMKKLYEVHPEDQEAALFYGRAIIANAPPTDLERSAWREAAALSHPGTSAPFVEAVTRFARAIGAARSANPAQASVDVVALGSLRDSLKARNDIYWSTIVEAQRLAASAWIAHAGGRNDEAVRLARQGAELEETVEKYPVTPGPLLPARELEGDLLLELGRSTDALRAYEMTLAREPRRARALFGAARAAEKAGNHTVARARYQELLRLMDRADASRPEVRAAKRFLAR